MTFKYIFICHFILYYYAYADHQSKPNENNRVCDSREALKNIREGCPGPRNCQFSNPDNCQTYFQCQPNGDDPPIQHLRQCPNAKDGQLYWNDNEYECRQKSDSTCGDNGDDDDDISFMYRNCTHRSTFTEEEMEIARQFFIRTFADSGITPIRAPCQKLRVRRDFKCMSDAERHRWIRAHKQLYLNDSILNRLTDIHSRFWPTYHKSIEGFPGHFVMSAIVDEELDKIDPGVVCPYWDAYEGPDMHRSIIWDYLGRAGNKDNDYCIQGGYFDDVFLTREQRCIRREWLRDGTMPRIYIPEFYTSFQQSSNLTRYLLYLYDTHFKFHNFVGGYHGDLSGTIGPNDPAFYLFHNQLFSSLLQTQLKYPEVRMPFGFEFFGLIDYNKYEWGPADLRTAKLTAFNDIYVFETYQYGYGRMCSVSDKDVERALYLSSNTRPPLPRAVQRMRDTLPPDVFQKWWPNFYSGNYSVLDFDFYEVGNRNRGPNCRRLPQVEQYDDNRMGRRVVELFKYLQQNSQYLLYGGEDIANEFIEEMNRYGYCSPYA